MFVHLNSLLMIKMQFSPSRMRLIYGRCRSQRADCDLEWEFFFLDIDLEWGYLLAWSCICSCYLVDFFLNSVLLISFWSKLHYWNRRVCCVPGTHGKYPKHTWQSLCHVRIHGKALMATSLDGEDGFVVNLFKAHGKPLCRVFIRAHGKKKKREGGGGGGRHSNSHVPMIFRLLPLLHRQRACLSCARNNAHICIGKELVCRVHT